MTAVPPDLLRALVREVVEEVLRDVLAGALGSQATAYRAPSSTTAAPTAYGVRAPSPQPVRAIDRGAVTESVVRQAAQDGVRLLLGRRAVLTPLARDLSRTLGVEVERRPDAEER